MLLGQSFWRDYINGIFRGPCFQITLAPPPQAQAPGLCPLAGIGPVCRQSCFIEGAWAGRHVIFSTGYSTASLPSLLPLPLCCFFSLHIIFRLVSFRPGGTAPPHTVPGWCGQGVPIHSQTAAAPPPGAHAVSTPATECTGPAAPGDPAAAPAVPGEAQATVSAAAAAPQQGESAQLSSGPHLEPDVICLAVFLSLCSSADLSG